VLPVLLQVIEPVPSWEVPVSSPQPLVGGVVLQASASSSVQPVAESAAFSTFATVALPLVATVVYPAVPAVPWGVDHPTFGTLMRTSPLSIVSAAVNVNGKVWPVSPAVVVFGETAFVPEPSAARLNEKFKKTADVTATITKKPPCKRQRHDVLFVVARETGITCVVRRLDLIILQELCVIIPLD